jgi:hypothetical protein
LPELSNCNPNALTREAVALAPPNPVNGDLARALCAPKHETAFRSTLLDITGCHAERDTPAGAATATATP